MRYRVILSLDRELVGTLVLEALDLDPGEPKGWGQKDPKELN
jgi:hypothetical protein